MADSDSAVQRARKEGNYFFKQKQYDAAIIAYRKGLDVEKDNVLLLSNLAQVYLVTEQYTEAEDMACRAIKFDPTWYKCYIRAAVAAENTGRIETACDYMKKGIDVLSTVDSSKRLETPGELEHFKKELMRLEEKLRLKNLAASKPCGLVADSDNDDSEEYDADSDTHSVSSLNSHHVGKGNMMRSDSLGKVNVSSSGSNVDRSRSASVPPSSLIAAGSAKKKAEMPPPSSPSIVLSTKEKKKSKKKLGAIKLEDLEADPFISFISTASLVPDDKVEREKFFLLKKKEIKALLMEGSQALEAGVFVAAVEKFRSVYDNSLQFPCQELGLKEMDVVVIKYLLCFSWVSLTIYEDIVQAIKMMQDMETKYSSKFPAIYYALGLAFYKLNRFNSAAVYVERGLDFIRKNLRLYAYPWPGTVSKPIRETTREGFEYVLTELLKNCRTHHQPNAVCRYEHCRKLSQHIEPSELIFYNDPDFNGFIVVICEEKCRIEYHVQCWKDFKESSSIEKVTDKDILGQNCPTEDCVTKRNQHSLIIRIEIMDESGAMKTYLDWTRNTDASKDARMNKRKGANSESLSEKHKRSGREKSKEKEHETLKELRRQEKYRKSELDVEQENHKEEESTEPQKSTNKSKPEENQRLQKNQKEDHVNVSRLPVKVVERTEDQAVDVERPARKGADSEPDRDPHREPHKEPHRESDREVNPEKELESTETNMLHENNFSGSCDLFDMSVDSLFGSDSECLESEGTEIVDVLISLHDHDCFADYCEELLLNMYSTEWIDEREICDNEVLQVHDPSKAYFGVDSAKTVARFLPENEIKSSKDEIKEFICSYMYEFLRSADSQTVQDVDDKWIEDSEDLKMDLSRVKQYQTKISDLLVISPYFAALDNHFGLAEFVPVLYDMLKEELLESFEFVFNKENTLEIADIYNSQEDLSCDGQETDIGSAVKKCEVNGSENVCDENKGMLNIKSKSEDNIDVNNLGVEAVENRNKLVTDKLDDGKEIETPITEELQKSRNSLNPDATEFCFSSGSSVEVLKTVTSAEAEVEQSNKSQGPNIPNSNIFLPNLNSIKWSTEDGETKPQSEWDANKIVKEWSSDGETESQKENAETRNFSFKDVKFSMSDKTINALTELLATFSERRHTIWTGMLKWTAVNNEPRAVSCSVLCSNEVKHAELNASLWPNELSMQLVSHSFVDEIGFDTLCELSSTVLFELSESKDSQSLAQDLSSEFAGVVVSKTSVETAFIVLIYFQNTRTYVGLAPHQCVSVLSGMLSDFCSQPSLDKPKATQMEVGVQTDGPDYELRLSSLAEENEKLKLECDKQSGKIESLSATIESLQSQNKSHKLLLEAEKKVRAELSEKCSQQERDNAKLLEEIRNLEKQRQEFDTKCRELEQRNQVLEELNKKQQAEKQSVEAKLAEVGKLWEDDKDQVKIMMKKNELSEKLFTKKIEAVEETNKTLRQELTTTENNFKRQIAVLTDGKNAQIEELKQLRQKLALMDQQNRQQLEISQNKMKVQQDSYQEKYNAHLQEMWNYKFEAVNRLAMVVMNFCKGRVDELTRLATAVVSNGNTTLHNEVNELLKIWQSCLNEASQQLDSLKETYPGLLEKVKSGEVVNFPEFSVSLPSQPQNLVDLSLRVTKKPALLPTPMPMTPTNSSHFTGNPVYYPTFPNSQIYIPQPLGFTQIPGMNLPASQRLIPMYSGNHVAAPEPVPDQSPVRKPVAPITALQNVRINNFSFGDPAAGDDVSVDKKLSAAQPQREVESPPSLTEANSVEPQEKKLNTATRLKKTIVQQSLAASKELPAAGREPLAAGKELLAAGNEPPATGKVPPAAGKEQSQPAAAGVASITLAQLQALAKKASDIMPSVTKESTFVAAPKQPVVSKPPVTSTADTTRVVPAQVKPVVSTVPFATRPVTPTVSSAKVVGVPVKPTVAPQQSSVATTLSSTTVAKPPSLLDLPRMPVPQVAKVQHKPNPKSSNFQKLIAELKKKYANKSEEELEACITVVRERNNNRLTGLPLPTIITMVGKVLQEQARKKDGGSMGLDKFGTTAWQLKSAETVQWSKPKDTSDEECTICIEPLGSQTTTLYCNHSFHTACIRKWLGTESVCPICRVYTRMADEFPPLA